MKSLLSFEEVDYYYQDGNREVNILRRMTYEFSRGKMYAVLGPSGSGKSTFLALAGGLDVPRKGRIKYDGTDVMSIGLPRYRKVHSALVFQSYNLIPYLTAIQNVILAMDIAKVNMKDKRGKALQLLQQVGLTKGEFDRNVLKLSGGQQQRVAIARALACDVDLLLADEPTGNLDQITAESIIDIFKQLAHVDNKCIIIVTHSQTVADAADDVLILEDGKFTLRSKSINHKSPNPLPKPQ